MLQLFARYQQENQSVRARLRAGSQLYQTSVGMIEAAITGTGSTVLISHGSGGGYDMGLWLAGWIGSPFQCLAPSRFGYLRSPSPSEPTPENQADIYAALLDVMHISSAVIIGLSAGGASALQFALRHPDRCRGLMMLSAVSRPVPPLPTFLRIIYPFMLKSNFIPWLLYTLSPQSVFQANGISPALLARIKPDQGKMILLDALYHTTFPSTPRRDGMINDLHQLTDFPLYPLEQINVPTLVVHAENDPIIPIASGEFSAGTIPNARFIRLTDGGHFVCVTHREEIIPAVQEFLNMTKIHPG